MILATMVEEFINFLITKSLIVPFAIIPHKPWPLMEGIKVGFGSKILNSIIYYNGVDIDGTLTSGYVVNNCCYGYFSGFPKPTNSTQENPQFIDLDSQNYRLTSSSPCINGGSTAYASYLDSDDLDENPRTIEDIIDIGAYEYQYLILISSSSEL